MKELGLNDDQEIKVFPFDFGNSLKEMKAVLKDEEKSKKIDEFNDTMKKPPRSESGRLARLKATQIIPLFEAMRRRLPMKGMPVLQNCCGSSRQWEWLHRLQHHSC